MVLIILFFLIIAFAIYSLFQAKSTYKKFNTGDKISLYVIKQAYEKGGYRSIPFFISNVLLNVCLYPLNYGMILYHLKIKKLTSFNQLVALSSVYSFQTFQLGFILIVTALTIPIFFNYGFDNYYSLSIGYYLVVVSFLFLISVFSNPYRAIRFWTVTVFNEKALFLIIMLIISAITFLGYSLVLSENLLFKQASKLTFSYFFQFNSLFDFVRESLSSQKFNFSIQTSIYIHGALFYSTLITQFLKIRHLKKKSIDYYIVVISLIYSRSYSKADKYLNKVGVKLGKFHHNTEAVLKLCLDDPKGAISSLKLFLNKNQEEDTLDVIFIQLLLYCKVFFTNDHTDVELLRLASESELKSYTYSIIRNDIEQEKYYDEIDFEGCHSKSEDSISFEKMAKEFKEVEKNDNTLENKFNTIAKMKCHSFNQNCMKFYYLMNFAIDYKKSMESKKDENYIALRKIKFEISDTLRYFIDWYSSENLFPSNFFFYNSYVKTKEKEISKEFPYLNELFRFSGEQCRKLYNAEDLGNFSLIINSEETFSMLRHS